VKLAWTPQALADRRAIYDYIEADNPRAALALDQLITKKAGRLINHPKMGRPGRVENTRELVAHRSYILVYDIAGDTVRVLRVLHTAQQWPPAHRAEEGV
jgi:toxin ParE1/3/4